MVLSWGSRCVLSLCGSGYIACFFIHLHGSLCVEGLCMTWLMPVGIGERKGCENSLGYNIGVLDICVNYYRRIMWMFCTYLCLVLCIFSVSSGWGVSSPGGTAKMLSKLMATRPIMLNTS